jgi:hypothetical protein
MDSHERGRQVKPVATRLCPGVLGITTVCRVLGHHKQLSTDSGVVSPEPRPKCRGCGISGRAGKAAGHIEITAATTIFPPLSRGPGTETGTRDGNGDAIRNTFSGSWANSSGRKRGTETGTRLESASQAPGQTHRVPVSVPSGSWANSSRPGFRPVPGSWANSSRPGFRPVPVSVPVLMGSCDSLASISPRFVSFAWRYHRCRPMRSSPPA